MASEVALIDPGVSFLGCVIGSWVYPGEYTSFPGSFVKTLYENDIQGMLGSRPWAPGPTEDVLRSCSTEVKVRAKIWRHAQQLT